MWRSSLRNESRDRQRSRVERLSARASTYFDPRTHNKKEGTSGMRLPMDVWYGRNWGRIQGNNKERRHRHHNQIPEVYLERVILSSRWAFHMTDCSPLFESAAICEAADDALTLDDPGAIRLRKGLEKMVERLEAAGRSVTFIAATARSSPMLPLTMMKGTDSSERL